MNIIVTGASRGIGFDMVLELSKNSAHNIIAISRNTDRLEALKKQCLEQHNNAITIVDIDLANLPNDKLNQALEQLDCVDVLINNAGVLINKPFLELTAADWQQMFSVNLFTVVELVKAAFPKLSQSAKAHIVNIGSMGGFQGSSKFPGLSGYSASKAALANLTECLAEEMSAHNIKVNCLALGAVNTEMLGQAFPDYKAPLDSHEMAKFITDFALNTHQYLNGKVIPVSLTTP